MLSLAIGVAGLTVLTAVTVAFRGVVVGLLRRLPAAHLLRIVPGNGLPTTPV